MSKKLLMLLALFISVVFISGCISEKDETTESKFIPQTSLPSGFTYMGTNPEATIDIGTSQVKAVEGVYRHNMDDLYVQVIKNENPEELIARYKLRYKDANYDPFEEVYVNGHKATKVTDYSTISGKQEARYTMIWATEGFMLIVGGSSDVQSVMSLASATGG